jgi:hypothetical protein
MENDITARSFSSHITYIYVAVRARCVPAQRTYFHYSDITGWNAEAHPTVMLVRWKPRC